jgi:phytoene synthase
MEPAPELRADDLAYVTSLVRGADRARYFATLFAPAPLRPHLFSLYGFAAEIGTIPDKVSEAELGQIRLQWWSDALEEAAAGPAARDSPVLRALSQTISRFGLPTRALQHLATARSADLYADPPATVGDLEGLLGETESALFQLAALVLGSSGSETAQAAGHAGIAYGLMRRLQTFASDRARGRTILPADILAQEGLSASDIIAAAPPPGVAQAVAALIGLARSHLRLAGAGAARLRYPTMIGFLPLAVVGPALQRIERLGPALLHESVMLSDLELLRRLAGARLRLLGGLRGRALTPP